MTISSWPRVPCSATQNTGISASTPTPARTPLTSRSSPSAMRNSSDGRTPSSRGSRCQGTATAAATTMSISTDATTYPAQSTSPPIGTSAKPSTVAAANGAISRASRRSIFIENPLVFHCGRLNPAEPTVDPAVEPAGLEPATSALQRRRSSN